MADFGDLAFSLFGEGGGGLDAGNFSLGVGRLDVPNADLVPGPVSAPDAPWSSRFGSGVSDFAGRLGTGLANEFTGKPLQSFAGLLGLGATGMGVVNQMNLGRQMDRSAALQKQAQERSAAAAAPAVAFGTGEVERAGRGQLDPGIEAGIQQWVQKAKADLRARYAQMGLGNSSDIQTAESQIDLVAEAMKGQLLQGQATTGVNALSLGVQQGGQGAQVAQQQQQLLVNLIAAANQQLGRLGGQAA